MAWVAHIDALRLVSGSAVYARDPQGNMRHLCEVGHRCVFGGLVAEWRGEGSRPSSFNFEMADDETAVCVYRVMGRPLPPDLPLNDEPDYEAILADREHAAL